MDDDENCASQKRDDLLCAQSAGIGDSRIRPLGCGWNWAEDSATRAPKNTSAIIFLFSALRLKEKCEINKCNNRLTAHNYEAEKEKKRERDFESEEARFFRS